MKIRRLSKLYGCRIFRHFIWATNMPDFSKFNIIYGWNGSGKTTISRILRDLELGRITEEGTINLLAENPEIPETRILRIPPPIRVFNRDFIEDSVFPIDGGDVKPIFVLGRENVEKEKQLNSLKSDMNVLNESLEKIKNQKDLLDSNLNQHSSDKAKLIKFRLGEHGNYYSSYNRTKYKWRMQRMISGTNHTAHILDDAKQTSLNLKCRVSKKKPISKIKYEESDFTSLKERVVKMLSTSVISQVIASLKDDSEISTWVYEGLDLHRKKNTTECLFCNQPIPEQRISAIENHFNDSYKNFCISLETLEDEIRRALTRVSELEIPDRARFYEQYEEEYGTVLSEVERYRSNVSVYLSSLVSVLSEKKNMPFEHVSMDNDMPPPPDSSALDRVGNLIEKHNATWQNHNAEADKARHLLESAMVAENFKEFVRLDQSVKDCDKDITTTESKIDKLANQIAFLENDILEHLRPAKELNSDLSQYLGHNELQLRVQDRGYIIIRGDAPALHLSEGERTAIALLYFLKSLDDHRFDLKNGVIVLDDPVSSLDAGALFLAHSFIQERTRNAGQLFILTHNFALLRLTCGWFKKLSGQNNKSIGERPAQFYMLNCTFDNKGRSSNIEVMDSLLKDYESDYHYLFEQIWNNSNNTTVSLNNNYSLPNMARRLLEGFFAFSNPGSKSLWKKITDTEFDKVKTTRILRFVNTHSHGAMMLEPENDLSLLGETSDVLSDILDLIKSENEDHFNRMIELVKSTNN